MYIILATAFICWIIYLCNNPQKIKGNQPKEDYTFIYWHDWHDSHNSHDHSSDN